MHAHVAKISIAETQCLMINNDRHSVLAVYRYVSIGLYAISTALTLSYHMNLARSVERFGNILKKYKFLLAGAHLAKR